MEALQSYGARKFAFFTVRQKIGFPSLSISTCIAAKEVMKMEERNEASASIWVWVVIIAIAAALVAGFVIFLRP